MRKQPPSKLLHGSLSYNPVSEEERVRDRAKWFIRMRWIALTLAGLATLVATRLTSLLPAENLRPLLGCLAALAGGNVVFSLQLPRTAGPYRLIIAQVVFDLVILTLLLHYSGGIENLFYLAYLFHIIIGGIILTRRHAACVTVLTIGLFLSLALLEYLNILHHSYIGLFPHGDTHDRHAAHDLLFVAGRAVPFALAIVFTAYFTILLREQTRRDQAEVVQAGKMATVGELAGRFAHEVNNPIGIITTNAGLLLENRALPADVLNVLRKIDKHGRRVAELTRGLLSFSRPSLGEKIPLDLNRVVQDALALLEPTTPKEGLYTEPSADAGMASEFFAKRTPKEGLYAEPSADARMASEFFAKRTPKNLVRVEKRLSASLPRIHGNANEIQQVVLNVAGNALDAMPKGGTLTVESRREADGAVSLTLADTGAGIPKDLIARVFDPFFTTKADGKGTGLGLSIAHGLVRSHNGSIHVRSEVGVGTIVTILFPGADASPGGRHAQD